MAILNMHIRNDYSNWGIEFKPRKRVTTLCGKMSLPKYCGVPGVTQQEPVADAVNADYGWCLACCGVYLFEMSVVKSQVEALNHPGLTNLYLEGVRAATEQVKNAQNAQAMSRN